MDLIHSDTVKVVLCFFSLFSVSKIIYDYFEERECALKKVAEKVAPIVNQRDI